MAWFSLCSPCSIALEASKLLKLQPRLSEQPEVQKKGLEFKG